MIDELFLVILDRGVMYLVACFLLFGGSFYFW